MYWLANYEIRIDTYAHIFDIMWKFSSSPSVRIGCCMCNFVAIAYLFVFIYWLTNCN